VQSRLNSRAEFGIKSGLPTPSAALWRSDSFDCCQRPCKIGSKCLRCRCLADAVAATRGEFGLTKYLIFLAIVILIFGASRLPTLARAFGESITEFKKGIKGIEDQSEDKKET